MEEDWSTGHTLHLELVAQQADVPLLQSGEREDVVHAFRANRVELAPRNSFRVASA